MAESKPESDDVKAKFREALERKQAARREREHHTDGHSKANHVHGPATAKREFRRKSG